MQEVKLITRGEFFYLEYIENGKRIRKSTGLKTTKTNAAYVARNIIPELEYKLRHRINTAEIFKLSYFTDKVLKDTQEKRKLNTFLAYQHHIKTFFKIIGDKSVDEYSVRDIETFCDKAGGRSFSSRLAPISLAFDIAMRYELIHKNPAKIAKKPNLKPQAKQPFSPTDMKRLLQSAQGELKTLLYFAFYTGARSGEILALTWGDIGESSISITKTKLKNGSFNAPKNGKSREILLLDPLREYLNNLKSQAVTQKNTILTRNITSLSADFKKLQRKLGIRPAQTLHATRHTFASMLINAQVRPVLVQSLLGHQDLAMTAHYTHFMASKADQASVEKALNFL